MKSSIFIKDQLIKKIEKRTNGKWIVDPWIEDWKNHFYIQCVDCNKITKKRFHPSDVDKSYLCSSCGQKGSRNSFFGKNHSQEMKNKLSEERKGKWCIGEENGMYNKTVHERWIETRGKDIADILEKERRKKVSKKAMGSGNSFYGKKHSEEAKNKIIEKNKEYQKKLTKEEKLKISVKCSKSQRAFQNKNREYYSEIKRRAGSISHRNQKRYKMNKIESEISKWFEKRKIDVVYSIILGGYQYDFGNKDKKVLIEVHGDYWHGNPMYYNLSGSNGKRKLNEMQLSKKERDNEKQVFAENHGFSYYVIWEYQIKSGEYEKILEEIWTSN